MRKIEAATPDLNDQLATDIFKRCPRCHDPDVIGFEGDVICTTCGWDSIELSVESQLSAHCARFKKARDAQREGDTTALEIKPIDLPIYEDDPTLEPLVELSF